jgi:hypothetical protein
MSTIPTDEAKMESFTLKCKHGIDDLQSEFAFHGASQGDETRTNDVEVYKDSAGWLINIFKDVDPTDQQAVLNEAAKRKAENIQYIEKLHSENKFGEEYELTLNFQHNPAFDNPPKETPLESYRMIFL